MTNRASSGKRKKDTCKQDTIVSIVYSSDGLVIDDIVPVINDITDGKTCCESVTFTITEENLDTVRVWLEVTKTDESSIPAENQEKVAEAAEEIMGDNPTITYFDADLFKQVEGGEKTQLHEPGIAKK